MSSTTIKVDTAVILQTASKIEGYIQNYESSYQKVNQLSKEVDATWDGTDNDKYKEQLNEFHGDFDDLRDKLTDYVNFLKKAADQYETAQENLTQDASKLAANR